MKIESLNNLASELSKLSLKEALVRICEIKEGGIVFSTSFGQEDQVITHSIFVNELPIEVFTLDTGRLFQETYNVFDSTISKYRKSIKTYFPNQQEVEKLLRDKGPNSFYESVENRKECCRIRKIEPLKRALKNKHIWITGLRATQSQNREQLAILYYDKTFDLYKFNPLINWSLEEVEKYLKEHNIPQNSLHKQGFKSIGCSPCTRAIEGEEDIRAGRWWWEDSKKECGLHR